MHHRGAGAGPVAGRISLIVDGGKSPRTMSSTIVHFKEDGTWQILREGAIPAKDIVEALS
jgi:tRNA A37 threonylcarbamoyladenosine synthetase subunit TsaC/SUA5/YrdC